MIPPQLNCLPVSLVIIPQTSKKLRGMIVLGLSVRASVQNMFKAGF